MANDAEELRELERRVRATIKMRMGLEQQLANPGALRSATAQALRDRDAVTSPLLEEARAKVTADIAAFHEEWHSIDKYARTVERLSVVMDEAPTHILKHRDALVDGLPEARRARARIGERLRTAGLASLLPEEDLTRGER